MVGRAHKEHERPSGNWRCEGVGAGFTLSLGMLWISTQYDNQVHLIDPNHLIDLNYRPVYSMLVPPLLGVVAWFQHSIRNLAHHYLRLLPCLNASAIR